MEVRLNGKKEVRLRLKVSMFIVLLFAVPVQAQKISEVLEKTTITDASLMPLAFDSLGTKLGRSISVDNFRLSGWDLDYSTASWIWNPNQADRDWIIRADTIATAINLVSSSGYLGIHEPSPTADVHITNYNALSPVPESQLILVCKTMF